MYIDTHDVRVKSGLREVLWTDEKGVEFVGQIADMIYLQCSRYSPIKKTLILQVVCDALCL